MMRTLDQAFTGRAWHGPTLMGTLRGMTVRQALWRPAPGRNTVWQLVLHTAYWKDRVRARLAGERGSRFPRGPANFPAVPEPADQRALAGDLELLQECHRRLREVVAALPARRLDTRVGRSRWTHRETIIGIASHDLYHAGQIQLIRRLYASRR
ncbi:MAG TPA: DinB family protein [Gemmatimonadales bacterium]|nr:DinB family protein [Gemmatimonadales bacterium]